MVSPSDIASAKEHFDVVATLFLLTAAGLLGCCIWIFRQHDSNNSKTVEAVEKNSDDIITLQNQAKQSEKTAELVEQHGKQIARLYTGVGKIMASHNINHPGQNLEI